MNQPSKKVLATAVLCSLLAASPVWAATPQTTNSTVNKGNSEDAPYSAITVPTGEPAIGVVDNTGFTVYVTNGATVNSLVNNTMAGATLTISGNMEQTVTRDDAPAIAFDLENGSTTNVDSPAVKVTSTNHGDATGATVQGSTLNAAGGAWTVTASSNAGSASAYGIQNYDTAISASAVTFTGAPTVTVEATNKEADSKNYLDAVGLYNNGKNASITLKQGAAITATITDATDAADGEISSATAMDNLEGTITADGALNLTVTATGGQTGTPTVITTGFKNRGTANVKDLTINASAAGGTITVTEKDPGGVASAVAYGLCQNNSYDDIDFSLTAGKVTITSLTAKGGTATGADADGKISGTTTDSEAKAYAAAYGLYNSAADVSNSAMTIGSLDVTGTATGGSGDTFSVFSGTPVFNSYIAAIKNAADNGTATVTVDGAVKANVAATGGKAPDAGQPGKNSWATANAIGIENTTSTTVQDTNPTATITAASADLTVTAASGTGAKAGAWAQGIYNFATGGTAATTIANLAKTTVTVAGSTGSTTSAAYGIENQASEATDYDIVTNTVTHLADGTATFRAGSVESIVTATGGSTSAANRIDDVHAYGVYNHSGYGTYDSKNKNEADLTVTGPSTVAATATANAATPSQVEAFGFSNNGTSAVMSLQDATVTAAAAGGNSHYGSVASTIAQAIDNSNGGVVTARNLNLTATATGGAQVAGSDEARQTEAYGISTALGTVSATGAVAIKTSVTPGSGAKEYFKADSLFARFDKGTLNVGTDGTKSLGKPVQLEGDVQAYDGGVINLTLDGAESYLQGNVQTTATYTYTGTTNTVGTVNLTVTNGAVWRPVYDNRYGSLNTANETYNFDETTDTYNTTYNYNTPAQTATTTDNSIGTLALSNGGIVDLTWDNATRDPATEGRTLTIDTLSGEGGVFKINSNLAQNKADEITLGSASTSKSVGIDVAYDPALAASGLDNNSDISGKALVLTDKSGKLASVKGVADSYNLYDYTPTITANGDGTYSLTKLTITNVKPAPTPDNPKQDVTSQSQPMREARHNRMALHNLWVNGELNNLQKRLGDLRAAQPADSGIWARYEYDKLEKGSDASLKYNLFQLGYDKDYQGETGTFYRGAAFSYAKGTGSYEVSNGDLKEGTLSLYQTWAGKDGRYYDVILKGGKLMSSYDLNDTANPSSADYHTWAYSLSGEIGKRFNKTNGFYVEPQFEFTLGRINGADYTTSTGMDVNVGSQNTALARLGISAGRETAKGSYFAKASYYHDFGGGLNLTASDSTTNPYSYGEDIAKNWLVFSLGGTAKAGKNCNIYGELSKFAGQLTNDVQVNIGARWSF